MTRLTICGILLGFVAVLPGSSQSSDRQQIACEAFANQDATGSAPREADTDGESNRRSGRVRVKGHSLEDDNGPFLGLGVSYFTALWRCKNDRERLNSDLDFLSRQGFNYYRMLAMVGWNSAWDGLEIAPVAFKNKKGGARGGLA